MIMDRRSILGIAMAVAGAAVAASSSRSDTTSNVGYSPHRGTVITRDGVRLSVKDYGEGPAILFVSAWCFTSDAWGQYIEALSQRGFRCVAYDRRGHGKSDDPGRGYDADTLADDLAAVVHALNLDRVTIVAHSMGSLEAVRSVARHGFDRIARLVLVAPVTPFLTLTPDNPSGIPATSIEGMRQSMAADFPQWIKDNEAPFFVKETSQAMRDWAMRMMESVTLPVALACHRTLTSTDCRPDLAKIDRPVLIIQGDKDASMPLAITGELTKKQIVRSRLTVYEGAPHGLPFTHFDRLVQDIIRQAQ
jgi:non-heme chloroperoxidase